MEPLDSTFRTALLQAHEGLAEQNIDEVETLLSQRFMLDPETQADRLAEMDARIAELMNRHMPGFSQVAASISTLRASEEDE